MSETPPPKLALQGAPDPNTVITSADREFLGRRIGAVPGWLFEPAGLLSTWLIRSLNGIGSDDCIAEIGVFHGKYLAALRNAASSTGCRLLGIDTFQFIPAETVNAHFIDLFGLGHAVQLWPVNSQDLDPHQLRQSAGRLRFLSIDGDHTARAVEHDLALAEAALSADGIVAADDFLNPLALGATEGILAYLRRPRRDLAPFAFAGNKLFLCRPDHHRHYLDLTRRLVVETPHLSEFEPARELVALGEPYFAQQLAGGTCLLLSLGLSLEQSLGRS